MIKKLILFIFFPILALAQESTGPAGQQIISIKDYNPQQKYEKGVCIVDLYGDLQCKDPIKPKVDEEKKVEKNIDSLKPQNPLIPAANSGWLGQVSFTGIGTFRGLNLLTEYRSGQIAYGGGVKFNMYSPPITDSGSNSKLEVMALGEISYYVFPRWYAWSQGKKVFDLSINAQLGYNYVTESVEGVNRKSEPVLGLGARVSYPVTDSFRLQLGVDMYQNFSLKSVGTSGSIGIGFGF